MRRASVFTLGLLWVLAGCAAGPAQSESSNNSVHGDGRAEAHLSIARVKGAYINDSVLVHAVHVRIDGQLIESCQLEELEQDVCGRDIALVPGAHRVAIGISCRDAETLSYLHSNGEPCEFTLEEEIVVSPGESLELDLSRASRDLEHFEQALLRKTTVAPATDCRASVNALVAANTCRSEGLNEAATLARKAHAQCEDENESNLRHLVNETYASHSSLSPNRCLPSSAIRNELPSLLTSGYSDWPGKSLPDGASTWSWVRSSLSPQNTTTPSVDFEKLAQALSLAAQRAVVFDQLAAAFSAQCDRVNNQKQAMQAALVAPFSLNPSTVEGHRNFVLVVTETQDAAYQDFIARGVQTSKKIHCDSYPFARQLSLFFTRSGLSRPEWTAVQAMMTRTPRESRVHDCDYAFREDSGVVPLEERLDWLFRFDCDAERRHPALLGDRAAVHLDPDSRVPPELRTQLTNKFRSCLTTRCQRESCSWFPGTNAPHTN